MNQINGEDKKINPWNGEKIPTNEEDKWKKTVELIEIDRKKYRKFRSRYIDIFCFIVGPFLIAYNLFNFETLIRPRGQGAITYYYSDGTRLPIALGACLVCWGFLNRYWTKNEKSIQ